MDEIRTERLLLRRAREDDLAALHAVLSDPKATRYWSTPPHVSLDETRQWLADMMAGPAAPTADFIVELDGRTIGKTGCFKLPEIGYILRPDHWGRGYAREALAAATAHIFAHFDVPALVADVDPRNAASIRLLERTGFVRTGAAARTWEVGGEWCDSLYYALKRP